MLDNPNTQRQAQQKPPHRYWHATHRRISLSQGINIALTAALVFVGVTQIIVYQRQAHIMRGQLKVMQTDSTIRRAELAAKMRLYPDILPQRDEWHVQPRWVNVGKTDALDVQGWEDFHIFHSSDEIKSVDFLSLTYDKSQSTDFRTIIIPDDRTIYEYKTISIADAWEIMYGNAIAVSWGFQQYRDIFNVLYTVRHCHVYNFEANGLEVTNTLPHLWLGICNQRTQKQQGNQN